jgi:FAD/FMN-containing dehydrogenase
MQTVLSADKTVASLGPGARWHDVYHSLEPHNLTVMGGRLGSLGVGGFLSGGKSGPKQPDFVVPSG